MIRNNFTSASIEFWRKHQAEKEALSRKNLIQGCFLAVGLFAMPFVILFALVLMSGKAHAVDYNAIATAYVTTTISQNVVFDSTMQAGGTFTFSVLAHNGGGRTGQSDTANVKIQFYTSANALVSSVNSSYSANLPQPSQSGTNGLSGNPQADPAVPWSTLTISSTNCGGSCANVAYAKISMYGIDGSYWAGDYGPWYRAPTFTLNGSSNLAYNPEFGPYNGITAQGWTSSPGFGACQGAWGGSNACIVNDQGQPGTSTAGLVANANGGGPSATGGTTSGQAGGYNNSMSTNNAGAGTGTPQTQPAPALTPTGPIQNVDGGSTTVGLWAGSVGLSNWNGNMVANIGPNWTWSCDNCTGPQTGTVISASLGSIGNPNDWMSITLNGPSESGRTYNFYPPGYVPTATSTSTSNQTSTSSSTGSTTTTNNSYTWASGTYTVTGSATPTTTTTTTTPVTTTTWSNGTTTTSNGTTTTTSNTTWDYSVTKPNTAPVSPNAGTNTNSVYITQTNAGASNKVTANQSGRGNYEDIRLGGSNNNINVGQGYTFSTTGVATESLSLSVENVSGITVSGNSNTITNSQLGQSNSTVFNVTGNNNSTSISQNGNNNQSYSKINGSGNSLTIGQTGNGNVASADFFGNNNTASVSQTGNNHGTVLNLVNAGGANTVSVVQTGAGDAYSLQQICTNPAGCSVSVIRNK